MKSYVLIVIGFICFGLDGICQDQSKNQDWKTINDSLGNPMNFYNIVETQPEFNDLISSYKLNIEVNSEIVDSIIKTLIPSRNIENSHMQLYLSIYGSIYEKNKDYQVANFMFKHAEYYGEVLDSKDFYKIGTNYFLCGSNDSAVVYLNKCLMLDSLNPDAYNNLGWSYLELNNNLDAVNCFRQAYLLNPLDVVNLNNYGYSLYLNNDLKTAEKFFLEAKSLDSSNSFVYRNLALIYMKKGVRKKACKNLEKSIELKIIEEYGREYISELIDYCNK